MCYCPKCKSRLYPDDDKFIEAVGVCGSCVTWDKTPDKRLQKAFAEYQKKQVGNKPILQRYHYR